MLEDRKQVGEITSELDGETVVVAGFVNNMRIVSKNLIFVILKDRSGDVQIILKKDLTPQEIIEQASQLANQSVIAVRGEVKETDLTDRGYEIVAKEMEVLSEAPSEELPVDLTDETTSKLDTRLNWRFLDLRRSINHKTFTVVSDFVHYSRDHFYEKGFVEIFTPKLIGAPTEGAAEIFEIEYFKKKAYLAQSPQFYKQMAMTAGMERIFEIAPVFRANPSFTSRHDTEYTSLDIEMSYIDSYEDILQFEEEWLKDVFARLKEKWGDELEETYGVTINVPETPFPRIKYEEALKIAIEESDEDEEIDESDLGSVGERIVGEYIKREYDHEFVFITHFPWEARPFYHMKPEDGRDITYSFDLLFKGIEITTGAQREHRYEILKEQAIEKGLSLDLIDFYLDFFKYGSPPHGGFGLSHTRVVMLLLELSNVRETTFLPRDPTRLFP